ncbi:unnamed protein product, partial [Oikopleura dioica]
MSVSIAAMAATWRNVKLPDLQAELDEKATDLAAKSSESDVSRKKLIGASKTFKKESPEDARKAAAPLLKLFQGEVDALSKRSKAAETAFLNTYKRIIELADPLPALEAAELNLKKLQKAKDIEVENQKLKDTINGYKKDFAEMKGHEITIQKLNHKIKELESENDNNVSQCIDEKEKELQSMFSEKERELLETQQMVAGKLGQTEQRAALTQQKLEQGYRFGSAPIRRLHRVDTLPFDMTFANRVILIVAEIKKSEDKYKSLYGLEQWKVLHDLVSEQYKIFQSTRQESIGKELNRNICQLLHGYSIDRIQLACAAAETMKNDFLPADLTEPGEQLAAELSIAPAQEIDSPEEQNSPDLFRKVFRNIKADSERLKARTNRVLQSTENYLPQESGVATIADESDSSDEVIPPGIAPVKKYIPFSDRESALGTDECYFGWAAFIYVPRINNGLIEHRKMMLVEYEFKDQSGNGLFIQSQESLDLQNQEEDTLYKRGMARLMKNNRVLRLPRRKIWDILPGGYDSMYRQKVEKYFNRGFKELSYTSFNRLIGSLSGKEKLRWEFAETSFNTAVNWAIEYYKK